MHICNDEIYGFITVPLEKDSSLEMDEQQLTNIKLEITGNDFYFNKTQNKNKLKSIFNY